ncbi:MAG: type II toxin-antitoxin system HicA family toxin [Candidatus Curtissbacteria bacterium]|nr:type II toxin-antitoxin system HicA family toxin [Candidatus Curtissbacteria bacterium]
MKSVKPRQLIKVLEANGFEFIRQKGNHRLFKKDNLRVTIPYHNKDLKPGTLRSILKQAEIQEEEL